VVGNNTFLSLGIQLNQNHCQSSFFQRTNIFYIILADFRKLFSGFELLDTLSPIMLNGLLARLIVAIFHIFE
jgi:hypothetical protein